MQSVIVYGRFLTRALISGVYNYSSNTEAAVNRKRERDFRLLAVACGFPKVSSRFSALLSRGRYGDDASFFARYKTADVLGMLTRYFPLSLITFSIFPVLHVQDRCILCVWPSESSVCPLKKIRCLLDLFV